MDKTQLKQYITETYGATEEHPWENHPDYAVFRHRDNRKWFALILNIPKNRLEPGEQGSVDVLNVKCDPCLIGSLREENGFYPAYHMNKAHWITMRIDGSIADEKIQWLLDLSFELTAKK